MTKELIAVVGATGAQGGGLARAIIEDGAGRFGLRALTRKPDSERGRSLAAEGAQVVFADLDDPASLREAFTGCYGAFCVTNFWEHFSPAKEEEQIANLVTAAAEAAVRHVVWSTLEDTRERVPLSDDRMPTLQGSYKVPHFDSKGGSDHLFIAAGVPTTFFRTSFYWDNLVHFGMGPTRGEDGVLQFVLPMGDRKLPGIAAQDIGPCAHGIFKGGDTFVGSTVGVAGQHATGAEMAQALSEAIGEQVRHVSPSWDAYRGAGFPGAEDLGNMFQYKHDFESEYCGQRPVEASRALHPGLLDFKAWLRQHAGSIARN